MCGCPFVGVDLCVSHSPYCVAQQLPNFLTLRDHNQISTWWTWEHCTDLGYLTWGIISFMILFLFCSLWVFVKFLKEKGAEDFLPWEFFVEYSKLGIGFLGGGGGGGGEWGAESWLRSNTSTLYMHIYNSISLHSGAGSQIWNFSHHILKVLLTQYPIWWDHLSFKITKTWCPSCGDDTNRKQNVILLWTKVSHLIYIIYLFLVLCLAVLDTGLYR